MNEVFRPLVILLSIAVLDGLVMGTLACLACLGWAQWPGRAQAARTLLEQSPGRCMLLGALDILGSWLVVMLLHGVAPHLARLAALCFILLAATLLLVGLPGLLAMVGQRILTSAERVSNHISSSLVGAVVLAGGGVLPWIGQAVLLLALLGAVGAAVMAALQNRVAGSTGPPV